jgi:hypothetical protein
MGARLDAALRPVTFPPDNDFLPGQTPEQAFSRNARAPALFFCA